jgi:hypothetical protein
MIIDNKYEQISMVEFGERTTKELKTRLNEMLIASHPIGQWFLCLRELIANTDGDTDLLCRTNTHGDNALLVESLDTYGDAIFKKYPPYIPGPLYKRYMGGIDEWNLKTYIVGHGLTANRQYFRECMAHLALISLRDRHKIGNYPNSVYGTMFNIIHNASEIPGELHE